MRAETLTAATGGNHDLEPFAAANAGRDSVQALLQKIRSASGEAFRDIEPIGLGRSGLVVLATPRERLAAPVALKIGLGDGTGSPDHLRFVAECETGQLLTHDHIVPVSPMQQAGDLQYFAMPYVGDERLDRLMEKGPVSRPQAISILRSLAAALDHAHGAGVLHGAIRPSKVHLLPTGRCQLSGFMLRTGALPAHEALAPSAIGDPAYMPPEQRLDSPALDGRADQYALAIIAAELLLGARPVVHGKAGVPEVLPVSSWLPALAEVDPERADVAMTRSTIDAIHRALLSKPELRFPSASAFVEALSRPITGEHHGQATPIPPPPWRRTFARRALLLLALLAALVYVPVVTRQVWRRAFAGVLVQPGDTPPSLPR